MTLMRQLRHPKEKLYGGMMYAVGGLVWAVVLAGLLSNATQDPSALIVLVIEVGVIWLSLRIAAAFTRAYFYGHHVLLGPAQLPKLHAMVAEGAESLGLKRTPRAFLYNSNGVINAFAARLVGKPYVLLTSSLVDADTDAQVRFVVGHELGHHVAGHLTPWKQLLKFPALFVPLLSAAYHRSRELTADRVGAYFVGDPDAACGALAMLACGSARMNASLSGEAFAAQEDLVPGLTGFLLKVFSGYPRLTTRVVAVTAYYAQVQPTLSAAADPEFQATH